MPDMRGLRWFADAVQDVRYVGRTLKKSPGFANAVILTLALGIGANTAVFSVVNAVLLTPLPYPHADRIVVLLNALRGRASVAGVSTPKVTAWRNSTTTLDDIAIYTFGRTLDVTDPAQPRPIPIARVSEAFFRLFGARIIEGRAFSAVDDRPGSSRVAVVTDRFGRERFGTTTSLVGRSLSLDGDLVTIVGVLDGSFDVDPLKPSLAASPAVWLPLQVDIDHAADLNFYQAAGRLRPGVTFEMAQSDAGRAAEAVRRSLPAIMPADRGLAVDRLQAAFVRDVRPSLLLLWAVVAFVLLIACTNIVNLLLVRASVRQREMAIRVATGASRTRIARQLLTESLTMALAGGGTGLALAIVGTRFMLSLPGWNVPGLGSGGTGARVDARVLLLTVGVSVATGIVCGVVPAYHAGRVDLDTALKSGAREHSGDRPYSLRGLLVIAEVAFALMLLVGSALLIRSFVALRQVNSGFDPRGVLTMQTVIVGRHFETAAAVAELERNGLARLDALPGVEIAAATLTGVPLEPCCSLNVSIVGRPREDEFTYAVNWNLISPGYFGTLKIPLLQGRPFTARDTAGATPVVMINQAMAKRYWAHEDPLRDSVVIGPRIGGELAETVPRRIVGIVGDVHQYQLRYEPHPSVYVPLTQASDRQTAFFNRIDPVITWIVRANGTPQLSAEAVQREVQAAGGGLPAVQIRSMSDVSAASTARERLEMWLVTTFGALALLMAAIGLYGVTSYAVQQRCREIGIRLALGAEPREVRRMVLRQAATTTLTGVGLGTLGALGLARFMAGFLFGVGEYDRASFVIVPLVLGLVALVAAWLPASRASAVDPMITLRTE